MRRSKLSNTSRAELLRASADRTSAECTEQALALLDSAVTSMRRNERISRVEALRRIRASRHAGRRPSRVAER